MRSRWSIITNLALGLALGCSSTSTPSTPPGGTGGGAATGGSVGTGGTPGATGGTPGTGGISTGGVPTTGGSATTGGSIGSGGVTTGGTPGGGSVGTGGSSGGSATTGGSNPSTGGTVGQGGSSGGTTAQGGSTPQGGTANPPMSGLPIPPTSNVAKPSGTGTKVTPVNWAGFKAAVSYTFDDTNSSQISNFAALDNLGVRMTFYLQTNKTNELNNDVWKKAVTSGHELANHSHTHQAQPAQQNAQSEMSYGQDLDQATSIIKQKFGVEVYNMAAPNGAAIYTTISKTRFMTNRGVSDSQTGGGMAPGDNTDPFNLKCYIPAQGASSSTMSGWMDSARSEGKWRIMLVHGFTGGSDSAYQPVALDQFVATVNHTKEFKDVWIDSVLNIGAYWLAQKAFSQATPTTSGSDKVYSWKLPEHFPPGKYLRVTVDGGTLKQGGATLPWDSHGYYEIALDAGSVTLSP